MSPTNILPLSFESHQVQVILSEGSEQWIASDVCKALGIRNTSTALQSVDPDEKGICIVDTLGGPQRFLTVTEPGLYKLIMKSRKPAAKKFARWVAHEVLPAIRRTGQFQAPQDNSAIVARLDQMITLLSERQEQAITALRQDLRQEMVDGFKAQALVIETRLQEQVPLALANKSSGLAKIDSTQCIELWGMVKKATALQDLSSCQAIHGRLRAKFEVPGYRHILNHQWPDALRFMVAEMIKGPKSPEEKRFEAACTDKRPLKLVK